MAGSSSIQPGYHTAVDIECHLTGTYYRCPLASRTRKRYWTVASAGNHRYHINRLDCREQIHSACIDLCDFHSINNRDDKAGRVNRRTSKAGDASSIRYDFGNDAEVYLRPAPICRRDSSGETEQNTRREFDSQRTAMGGIRDWKSFQADTQAY